MENNIFGKTNVEVSKLGLGLAQVGFQLGKKEFQTANLNQFMILLIE